MSPTVISRRLCFVSGERFSPSGLEEVFGNMPEESTHNIYSIDGRLVRRKTTLSEALQSLPRGIYLINGRKVMKE